MDAITSTVFASCGFFALYWERTRPRVPANRTLAE